MPTVADITAYLEKRVPTALKLDFDNVGLLCGFPQREVGRAMVMLDVTRAGIAAAQARGAELIVAHHPVIFTPLRGVTPEEPAGGRVISLLQADLSAICLHTNLDVVDGGVNTALAAALGAACTAPLSVGRVAELPAALSLSAFLAAVRAALGAQGIRYHDAGRPVRRLALCGGSGGDLLPEAIKAGCDTLLTGEIRHHQWLDGAELGINLIEAGHFSTENVVLPALADMLRQGFPALEVTLFEAAEPYLVF